MFNASPFHKQKKPSFVQIKYFSQWYFARKTTQDANGLNIILVFVVKFNAAFSAVVVGTFFGKIMNITQLNCALVHYQVILYCYCYMFFHKINSAKVFFRADKKYSILFWLSCMVLLLPLVLNNTPHEDPQWHLLINIIFIVYLFTLFVYLFVCYSSTELYQRKLLCKVVSPQGDTTRSHK